MVEVKFEGQLLQMMLDSGSAVSLISSEVAQMVTAKAQSLQTRKWPRHVMAPGEPIYITRSVAALVKIGDMSVRHDFAVVNNLIAPIIFGIDLLCRHGLILDFNSAPIRVRQAGSGHSEYTPVTPVLGAIQKIRSKSCAMAAIGGMEIDQCTFPASIFLQLSSKNSNDYFKQPGRTQVPHHNTPTTVSPIRVPP